MRAQETSHGRAVGSGCPRARSQWESLKRRRRLGGVRARWGHGPVWGPEEERDPI